MEILHQYTEIVINGCKIKAKIRKGVRQGCFYHRIFKIIFRSISCSKTSYNTVFPILISLFDLISLFPTINILVSSEFILSEFQNGILLLVAF